MAQSTTNRQFTAPAAAASAVVTPNASSWANSNYAEVIAITDAALVVTGLSCVTPGASQPFEVDLAVGAASSEAVITTFRGKYTNAGFAGNGYMPLVIPVDAIPLGSRVAVRMRKNGTSVTAWNFSITYYKKPILGTLLTSANPQKVGPPNAEVTITSVATDWNNGTYQTLIASAATDLLITGIVLPALSASNEWEVDLAVGAVSSEVEIATFHGERGGNADGPSYVPFRNPLNAVPAGSRVSARIRAVDTRRMDVAVTYLELPL